MKHLPMLITAAALLATASAQAQSNVSVSGVFDLFGGQRQLSGRDKLKTLDSGGMTTSRLTFDGTEDLGGGLKATFALSGFVRVDTGDTGRNATDGFWRRYAFVGLQGGFGTVRLGRQSTPSFANAIRFSPFGESTAFSPYMLSMYAPAQPLVAPMNSLDSAADNTVGYLSPSIGGFNGQALYSFGEVAGQSSRKRYSVGGIWANGPFAVGLSVEQTNIPNLLTAGVAKMQNLQSGASFDLGVAKLFGQYAKSELTLANGKRDFGTWQLGTSVPVGAGAVLLSYVQTKKDEPGLANVKRKTLGLGYDYNLSKRTDLYAVYLRDSVTPLASGTTAVVGMRHRF